LARDPGFTKAPKVEQISLTKVRVSWRGLVTGVDCADQFVVKSWPRSDPGKFAYVVLPTTEYTYDVDHVRAKRPWAYQVGGREDGGWLWGKKLSKSPTAYFTTSDKKSQPTVAPALEPAVTINIRADSGNPGAAHQNQTLEEDEEGYEQMANFVMVVTAIAIGSLFVIVVIIGICYNLKKNTGSKAKLMTRLVSLEME